MARPGTNTWGDRPVRLLFQGPAEPMTACGGNDPRGAEFLHGMLTDEAREALAAGGCNLRAWSAALLDVVAACGGRAEVELRGDATGLQLSATPAAGGEPVTRVLVRGDFALTYEFEGLERVVPMLLPEDGRPNFWEALTPRARRLLEEDGQTPQGVNAALLVQLHGRQEAGLAFPVVRLDLPSVDELRREKRREAYQKSKAGVRPRWLAVTEG